MIKITLLVQDSHVTVISIKLRTFIEFTRKNNERDIDFFFFFLKTRKYSIFKFQTISRFVKNKYLSFFQNSRNVKIIKKKNVTLRSRLACGLKELFGLEFLIFI